MCDRSLRQSWTKWTICSITPDFHWEFRCGLSQLRLILSCGWIQVTAVSSPAGWIQITTQLSSGGWIQVTVNSTRVPAAGYGLRSTPSHGCLEFWQLDTIYSWLHSTVESSSGGCYDLRLIPSCGWLRVAADSLLSLTRVRRLGSNCGWPIL